MIKNDPECSWIVFLFLHYLFVINQQGESKGEHPFGRVWRGFKGETKVLSRLWRLNFTFKRSACFRCYPCICVCGFPLCGSYFCISSFFGVCPLGKHLANARPSMMCSFLLRLRISVRTEKGCLRGMSGKVRFCRKLDREIHPRDPSAKV